LGVTKTLLTVGDKRLCNFFGTSLQSAVLTIVSSSRAVKQFCLQSFPEN